MNIFKKIRRTLGYYNQKFSAAGEYELRLLKFLVPRGSTVADVGANVGVYSFHLKKFSKDIWAFEPNSNYHQHIKDLGKSVRLEDFGLSEKKGEATLSIPQSIDASPAHGWGTVEVYRGNVCEKRIIQLNTLDSYGLDFAFIKIDVEGHELSVLRGAAETLKRSRPNLLIECEDRHKEGATSELFKLMTSTGYNGFFFSKRKCFSIESFDVNIHQREIPIRPGQPFARQNLDYVNNFVFLPKENVVPAPFRRG